MQRSCSVGTRVSEPRRWGHWLCRLGDGEELRGRPAADARKHELAHVQDMCERSETLGPQKNSHLVPTLLFFGLPPFRVSLQQSESALPWRLSSSAGDKTPSPFLPTVRQARRSTLPSGTIGKSSLLGQNQCLVVDLLGVAPKQLLGGLTEQRWSGPIHLCTGVPTKGRQFGKL